MTDYIEERLPPHNVEAEAAVLGSILIDQDVMIDIADMLTPDAFYRAANRWVYEAIAALHSRRDAIDILTVAAEIRSAGHLEDTGGDGYLFDLLNAVPTSINAKHYAGIVAEKATRRRLLTTAGAIAKAAYDETAPVDAALTTAEQGIIAIRSGGKTAVQNARQLAAAGIDELLNEDKRPPRTISTGLIDLDRILGGLNPPHQYVVAGRPGMGKSSLLLAMIYDAIVNQHKRVMLFSLEMSDRQIRNRLVSITTRIPVTELLRPDDLSPTQKQSVMQAYAEFSENRFYLDCTPALKPADIRARATRQHMETGLDMVVVDHLHRMRPDTTQARGQNRAREVGDMVLSLDETYKMLDVVGITAAQLSRNPEARAIKRPTLSDLRDSGEIEENAYAAIMLHRDAYYDPTKDPTIADASIAKNRDGETGQVRLYWNGKLATFNNLEFDDLNPPRSNGRVTTPPAARQGEIVL